MEEWITYKLGDVLTIKYGKDHKSLSDGPVPAFGSGGIMRYVEKPIFDKPSILIPRKGSLNNVVYIDEPFWTVDTMFWTIIDTSIVIPHFLYYTIRDIDFASLNVGSAVPSLTCPVIESIEVSIPSLITQRKILDCLEPIDEKIALNNRINHNLEEQAQALYKSWFVDFDPFKDGEFVYSALGRIPAGWSIQSMDSLCSLISRGFSPSYNEDSEDLVLGQRCVRNNMIDISLARKHNPKYLGERELQKWDILINSTGMGSLGRVAQLYFEPKRLTYDSHLTLVRARKDCYKQFIGRNLLARQDEIENMAVGSTGQTELPRDRVRDMLVICPPEHVMIGFGRIIEALSITMQSNIEMNESLARDRDELLPKLMSGEFKLDCLHS